MKRNFYLFILCLSSAGMSANVGSWIASGGIGLTASPALFLLSPQLEYVSKPNLNFGLLTQAGLGDSTIFTASGSLRYTFGHHPHVIPAIEGAAGIAAGSSYKNPMGVHLMFGMGMDYRIDASLSLGTTVRANFAPPMKTFFLSWPLIVARLAL